MKSYVVLAAMAVSFLLSGCGATRSVVAEAEGYNDLFVGTVTSDGMGTASISIRAKRSDVACTGGSRVTKFGPSQWSCAGQTGVFHVLCTDGRRVSGTFDVDSCEGGIGEGRDQDNHRFTFMFGMNQAEVEKGLTARIAQIAARPELPAYNPSQVRRERGFVTGTGFYVTDDGYLITNYHVIEVATTIDVLDTVNHTELPATIVQTDPANDVAILHVKTASKGVPLALAFTDVKGDEVLTLGYPLVAIQGQEQKATFGRINALSGIGNDIRYCQVDIPIQPGNSGGPLLNSRGEVIGVMTATLNQVVALKASGSLAQNVNYAVKVDYVLPLLNAAKIDRSKVASQKTKLEMPMIVALREPSVVLIVSK